jgi:hypothetical protein
VNHAVSNGRNRCESLLPLEPTDQEVRCRPVIGRWEAEAGLRMYRRVLKGKRRLWFADAFDLPVQPPL